MNLDQFVYAEKTIDILEVAMACNNNVILWGKGGYGKSEIAIAFFASKGITPFVQTLGSGTSEEKLLGGINVKKIQEDGIIEFLPENSFMNHEYVILEEALDAPGFILETLKDILTSGELRQGSQQFKIKTKMIVCCTNKDRKEYASDDSLKALMERFPLELKIEWKDHTEHNYTSLFRSVLDQDHHELAFMLELFHRNGTTISPRTAIVAAKIIDRTENFENLLFIHEFSRNQQLFNEARIHHVDIKKFIEKSNQVDQDFLSMVGTKEETTLTIQKENFLDIEKRTKKLISTISEIETLSLPDFYYAEKAQFMSEVGNRVKKLHSELRSRRENFIMDFEEETSEAV